MPTEKYSILNLNEQELTDKVIDCVFRKNMTIDETEKELHNQGIAIARKTIMAIKNNSFEILLKQHQEEHAADYMLESFERTKDEFNVIIKEAKTILESAKDKDDNHLALETIKEMRAQIELALTRQGKLTSQLIQTINAKNVNIINPSEISRVIDNLKLSWFDEMNPSITTDGKIIFNDPTPEFIDAYKKWSFNNISNSKEIIVEGKEIERN
jgi:hypothetical protein